MRVTRQQIQNIVKQEYKKLLKEMQELDDMGQNEMNMFGAGYEAASTDDEENEHVHDENCGHLEGSEHDDESRMFRSHLTSITKQAQELENIVQQGENVEEWVQEKMAVAASMIDSIYHYLSHGDEEADDMDDEMDSEMDDHYDEYSDEMDDDDEMEYDTEVDDETDDDELEYDDEMDDDELDDDELDSEYYDDEMDDDEEDELDQDDEDDEYELHEQSDYVDMDPAQYPEYGYKKAHRSR